MEPQLAIIIEAFGSRNKMSRYQTLSCLAVASARKNLGNQTALELSIGQMASRKPDPVSYRRGRSKTLPNWAKLRRLELSEGLTGRVSFV